MERVQDDKRCSVLRDYLRCVKLIPEGREFVLSLSFQASSTEKGWILGYFFIISRKIFIPCSSKIGTKAKVD